VLPSLSDMVTEQLGLERPKATHEEQVAGWREQL
jgi:hypothetical protein